MSDFDRSELFGFISRAKRKALVNEIVERALAQDMPEKQTPASASWEKNKVALLVFLCTQLYGRPKTAANPKAKDEEPSMLKNISTEKLKTLLNED